MGASERAAGSDRPRAWNVVPRSARPESWLRVWDQPLRVPVSPTDTGQEPRQRPALTILLIDDDPRTTARLARRLELDGHAVSQLPSVHSALPALEQMHWDLISIDDQPGDLPVRWLTHQVRARQPESYLVLTARYGHEPANPCWRLPAIDAVLPKPWTGREFEDVLAGALARRSLRT